MSFLISILLSIAATFGYHPAIGGGGPVHMSISGSAPVSAQPASGSGPVGKKK